MPQRSGAEGIAPVGAYRLRLFSLIPPLVLQRRAARVPCAEQVKVVKKTGKAQKEKARSEKPEAADVDHTLLEAEGDPMLLEEEHEGVEEKSDTKGEVSPRKKKKGEGKEAKGPKTKAKETEAKETEEPELEAEAEEVEVVVPRLQHQSQAVQ